MKALLQKGLRILIHRTGDGPWRSKSVFAAIILVVIGAGVWICDIGTPARGHGNAQTNAPVMTPAATVNVPVESPQDRSRPLPFYVPIAASYVAGFCIGWSFRKLIRLILAFTALLLALLALGRLAGCDITPAQERVRRSGEWAQHQAKATRDYLEHLLPSAGAGGAGAFLGFRRRGKTTAPVEAGSRGSSLS